MLHLATTDNPSLLWPNLRSLIYWFSISVFAAEIIPPEFLPMRLSCAWIPPFGLQVQDKTGRRWRLCVVDTVCECTLSASPHTAWHHLQDGVNDLHEIYRRISTVRGAWEVRKHIFYHLASSLCELSGCYVIGPLGLGTRIPSAASAFL